MTRLYHFTSFDSACKIIESGKLRFGKSFRMNDLIESNRVVFRRVLDDGLVKTEDVYAEEEMRRYQQISFAQDRECDGCAYFGFDLHSMWGLYADKGYGVCLVFDKKRLKLEEHDYSGDVRYNDFVFQDFTFHNKSRAGIKPKFGEGRRKSSSTSVRSGSMSKNTG